MLKLRGVIIGKKSHAVDKIGNYDILLYFFSLCTCSITSCHKSAILFCCLVLQSGAERIKNI